MARNNVKFKFKIYREDNPKEGYRSKRCSKCGGVKEINEFSKNKYTKDGLRVQCKDCVKEYYEENKEKIIKRTKEYQENNKEQIAKRAKEYRENNKEKRNRYIKKYRENNK